MKKLLFLTALCATVFFTACEQSEVLTPNTLTTDITDRNDLVKEEVVAAEDGVYTLYAGKEIEAGTVSIKTTETDVVVTYETSADWEIGTTHLYVGTTEDIPLTRSGSPKLGKFPYAQEAEEGKLTNTVTYTIPLSEVQLTETELEGGSSVLSCFYVSAHAELFKAGTSSEEEVQTETGFAAWDTDFEGSRWGGTIEICL